MGGDDCSLLLPHLQVIALADIPGRLVEPDRRRNEQGLASETSQLPATPLSSSFLPPNPLRQQHDLISCLTTYVYSWTWRSRHRASQYFCCRAEPRKGDLRHK